jgi:hypothetical protein
MQASTRAVSPLLRAALLLDAVATGASGLLMAAGGGLLHTWLGLPQGLLLGAGLALLPWAALVGRFGFARRLHPAALWLVVVANIVWAADCLLLAAGALGGVTQWGQGFALFQAVAVLLFAALQYTGWQRSAAAA